MKHITLSNILAVTGIVLIAIGCSIDAFTTLMWYIKTPFLIGGGLMFLLGYIEDGGKFGSH